MCSPTLLGRDPNNAFWVMLIHDKENCTYTNAEVCKYTHNLWWVLRFMISADFMLYYYMLARCLYVMRKENIWIIFLKIKRTMYNEKLSQCSSQWISACLKSWALAVGVNIHIHDRTSKQPEEFEPASLWMTQTSGFWRFDQLYIRADTFSSPFTLTFRSLTNFHTQGPQQTSDTDHVTYTSFSEYGPGAII